MSLLEFVTERNPHMAHNMTNGYSTTAEYKHIDVALKSFWKPFVELTNEIKSFVPQPLSAFEGERNGMSEKLQELNPLMSAEEISEFAKQRISSSYSPDWQSYYRFSDRFMTLQVTITLLSHALCEAVINSLLATGHYEQRTHATFAEIQKSDIKEKWVNGPKGFCPEYDLPKGSALYETLNHLCRQRNSWMHHKSHLHVGEEKIIEGSQLYNLPYKDAERWMRRYFSLPYDLATHAHAHTHQAIAAMIFYDRNPIPFAHK